MIYFLKQNLVRMFHKQHKQNIVYHPFTVQPQYMHASYAIDEDILRSLNADQM